MVGHITTRTPHGRLSFFLSFVFSLFLERQDLDVPCQDNIIYTRHDIPEHIRIRRVRVVHIHLLVLRPVQAHEPAPEELDRFIVRPLRSNIVREVDLDPRRLDLFPEKIRLVHK